MGNVIMLNSSGIVSKEFFVDQLGKMDTVVKQTQERIHSLYTKVSMNDRGEDLDQLILLDPQLNDKQKILYLLATIKERVSSKDVFCIEGLIALFLMHKEGLMNEEYTRLVKTASLYYNGDVLALENDITQYHLNDFCKNFTIHEVKSTILGGDEYNGNKKLG